MAVPSPPVTASGPIGRGGVERIVERLAANPRGIVCIPGTQYPGKCRQGARGGAAVLS